MDKYSFINNGKKKKNIKKPAGNDQWSNVGISFPYGERAKSEDTMEGNNVLINPFPENKNITTALIFDC
ncbi:MAG: hypothetical protein E7633_08990 [Ruminococcaceae bacterium]|nr:hypothetical protein [Oscillospiraceae bacterium]